MVLPINPILASGTGLTRADSEAILKVELGLLAYELPELQKYRAYYDGEQGMVFGSQKFKDELGPDFPDFRDNWCAPVVEAVADKLYADGLSLGTTDKQIKENTDLARQIWDIFRLNDFDEQQADLYEGALVEGRSYAIAWPDEELGVRIDWQRADMIRVRYADDDPRKIVWAMKRWLSSSGRTYITVYTTNFIYKYEEAANPIALDTRVGMEAQAPTTGPTMAFQPRSTEGDRWVIPNPFGIIPVVEFVNKRGSELTDVIPLQDGVNYMMLQALSAIGFQGFPQRGFMSGVSEPVGGWQNSPGKIWQLPPDLDAEGNLHYGNTFEFGTADISSIRSMVELALQHIALQTKTPVRMFFQSDRGGRGDAPSGESLLVEDQPSIDKTEDRQRRFGNSAFRLARMVARMHKDLPETIPLGELGWHDPRAKYRSALIAEGALMVDKMGMPLNFVATQLGFSKDEQELLMGEIENQKKEQEQMMEKQAEMAAANRPEPAPPSSRPE